ncbi:hypothetical protein [Sphingobium sp. HDIP04]|uniref:hypothetical protein n=1 Tax=Sphingobium sp. HDIP04 TaxID=428994 RepID=UPI0003876D22|nr:hypothetical protein [Sphingobium sp. HDIP04]EQA97280.1 hypothetical protein L286_23430 [Sphingobium sp. HDIP04]
MAEAAVRKVQAAMIAAIAVEVAAAGRALHAFPDRTAAEPLSEGEWPGYMIRYEVKFGLAPDGGQYFNQATFTFECQSGNTVDGSFDKINQQSITDISNALQADASLGGLLEDIQPIGSDVTQSESSDVGSAVLQVVASYYTLIHDHSTIVGVGGQLFP